MPLKQRKVLLTSRKEKEELVWRDRKLSVRDPLTVTPSIKIGEIQAQTRFSAIEAQRVRRAATVLSQTNKRPVLIICNARTGAIYKDAIEGISAQVSGKEKRKWFADTIRQQFEWIEANKKAKRMASHEEVKQLRETAIMKAAFQALNKGKLASFVYAISDCKIASIGTPAQSEAFQKAFFEKGFIRKRFERLLGSVKPIILFVDVASYNPKPYSFKRAKKAFPEFSAIEVSRDEKNPLRKISSKRLGEKPLMVLFDPSAKVNKRIMGFEHQPGWQSNLPQIYSKKLQSFGHKENYPGEVASQRFSTTRGPMTLHEFVSTIMREESKKARRQQLI